MRISALSITESSNFSLLVTETSVSTDSSVGGVAAATEQKNMKKQK
jgi:hypothetical protein